MAVKPGGATDPASRLERLSSSQDKRLQKVFLQAVALIKNQFTLDELADLLEQGKLEDALDAVEAAARLIGDAYGDALVASAKSTADFLSGALTVTVSFDQTNVRAVSAIQQNRLRLIREFTADQRATIRQAMSRGISEGLNPRAQARLFRETVGLTSRQEQAVARYRSILQGIGRDDQRGTAAEARSRNLRDKRFDRSLERAQRLKEPLSEEQIERMTSRYRERYVRYRSEVIGRTEALRSVHEGTEEMYIQALDNGELAPESLVRTWVTAKDERVRTSHSALNGQQRGIGEKWNGLRFPGDPDAPAEETVQCRCVLTTRIVD